MCVCVCPSLVRVDLREAPRSCAILGLQPERHARCFHDGRDHRDKGQSKDYKIDNEAQQDKIFEPLEMVRARARVWALQQDDGSFNVCQSYCHFYCYQGQH